MTGMHPPITEGHMPEPKFKVRDLAPTAVRLVPDLRHALAREAEINGRTLHGEIVYRLQQSVLDKPLQVNEQRTTAADLKDTERALVTLFRRLSPEKQLALLQLLKK